MIDQLTQDPSEILKKSLTGMLELPPSVLMGLFSEIKVVVGKKLMEHAETFSKNGADYHSQEKEIHAFLKEKMQ